MKRVSEDISGYSYGVPEIATSPVSFTADTDLIARKPTNLSMREAAALPLSTITAWEGLVDRAKVSADHKVLIHAGAGGGGHIAIQIARAFGAEVFTTVSADKKHVVEELSVLAIDYESVSVEEYVATYTNEKGFDIIFDAVGGATLDASFAAVKRYTGHVVSILGWGTQSLAPLSFRGATYSGVFTPLISDETRSHHGNVLAQAASLVQAGKLKSILNEKRFSISDIDAAYAQDESGSPGKVVVEL